MAQLSSTFDYLSSLAAADKLPLSSSSPDSKWLQCRHSCQYSCSFPDCVLSMTMCKHVLCQGPEQCTHILTKRGYDLKICCGPLHSCFSQHSIVECACNVKWIFLKVEIQRNTSLAAKGALAHRLQRRTACKIQNGRQGAPKCPTGSGKVSTPRFLGVPVNFR